MTTMANAPKRSANDTSSATLPTVGRRARAALKKWTIANITPGTATCRLGRTGQIAAPSADKANARGTAVCTAKDAGVIFARPSLAKADHVDQTLIAGGQRGTTGAHALANAAVARGTVPALSINRPRELARIAHRKMRPRLGLATLKSAATIALMEASLNGDVGQNATLDVAVDSCGATAKSRRKRTRAATLQKVSTTRSASVTRRAAPVTWTVSWVFGRVGVRARARGMVSDNVLA